MQGPADPVTVEFWRRRRNRIFGPGVRPPAPRHGGVGRPGRSHGFTLRLLGGLQQSGRRGADLAHRRADPVSPE